VFTYRELERATDGFSEGNVVGRGASGAVFRGRLADGTPAAIKRLRLDHRRQGEREFRIEVRPSNHTTHTRAHVAVASRHCPCAPVHVHVRRTPLRVRRTKPYLFERQSSGVVRAPDPAVGACRARLGAAVGANWRRDVTWKAKNQCVLTASRLPWQTVPFGCSRVDGWPEPAKRETRRGVVTRRALASRGG
jgi:hypothetical protein